MASLIPEGKTEMKMKKLIYTLLAGILMTGCAAAPAEESSTAAPEAEAVAEVREPAATDHAVITVRDYGEIRLDLDAETAPETVANFIELADSGFYDGLTFHRIMDGFMIQGGDPDGNGGGGSGHNITGEFSANGHSNTISHKAGVISMARRSNDMNSASSQFFIMVDDALYLDGQYAAFGWVSDEESLAVVRQIAKDAKPVDNNGTIRPEEQPVIESVVITE